MKKINYVKPIVIFEKFEQTDFVLMSGEGNYFDNIITDEFDF